jgi:hypothetical protein
MYDEYKRIAQNRHSSLYWTADSEVNLKELGNKLRKITKK